MEKFNSEKLSIAVLGYVDAQVGTWDPDIVDIGIPGSEEAVIYATQDLVTRGHRVVVYMNPPVGSRWSSSGSNPRWVPESDFYLSDQHNPDKYDVVLAWRRYDFDVA